TLGQPPDRAALTALLVQQVSERTGYPLEMLGLDHPTEGDLGIDSIKRVEILCALQERLPAAVVARVTEQMETLTRVKTLNGIVDRLLASTGAPANAAPVASAPAPEAQPSREPVVIERIPRFQIRPFREPLSDAEPARLTGLFLITEDELAVAPLVTEALKARGATPAVIDRGALADPALMDARVAALAAEHGPVSGIVHLAPLSRRSVATSLAEWRAMTAVDVKSLYHLLHVCAADLVRAAGKGQAWGLAAAAMGGRYGAGGRDTGGAAGRGRVGVPA